MLSVQTALKWAKTELILFPDTAALEAELLLADVLKKNRSHLLAFPEYLLTADEYTRFSMLLVSARTKCQPLI